MAVKRKTVRSLVASQNVLMMFVFTFVVVILWVMSSIYFSFSKSTLTEVDRTKITPLNPKIDGALFDKLAVRKSWSEEELNSFQPRIRLPENNEAAPRTFVIATPVPATASSNVLPVIASSSALPTSSSSSALPR